MPEILTDPFGWERHEPYKREFAYDEPPAPIPPTESDRNKWPLHFSLDFNENSQGPPRLWTLFAFGPTTAEEVEKRGDWYTWLSSLDFPEEGQMIFDEYDEFKIGFIMFGIQCVLLYRRGRGKRSDIRQPVPVGASE